MSDLPEADRRRRPGWAALSIAGALFVVAAVIVIDMQRLASAGAYDRIGPTAVPYAVAVVLALLGIGTVVSSVRGTFPRAEPQELRPVVFIVLGLLAQLLLLPYAGFIVATAALFVLVAFGFGERRVHLTAPFALVMSLVVWFVFAQLLKLTLPVAGPEHWLAGLMHGMPGAV